MIDPKRIVRVEGGREVLLPDTAPAPNRSYLLLDLKKIIQSDSAHILITGETGTGKEALADCIFAKTKRIGKKLRINCAGIEPQLMQSELFGHIKGAFTGAIEDRTGRLLTCNDGIIFLDEIGWWDRSTQAKLLRFMETGEIQPLGSDEEPLKSDVRIIAATNRDPDNKEDNWLAHDLRARFDFEIKLQPLKARLEDIPWFLCQSEFLGRQDKIRNISLMTLLGILLNNWPENVRGLKKWCAQAVALHPRPTVPDGLLYDPCVAGRAAFVSFVEFCALLLGKFCRAIKHPSDVTVPECTRNSLSVLRIILESVKPGVSPDHYYQGSPEPRISITQLQTWRDETGPTHDYGLIMNLTHHVANESVLPAVPKVLGTDTTLVGTLEFLINLIKSYYLCQEIRSYFNKATIQAARPDIPDLHDWPEPFWKWLSSATSAQWPPSGCNTLGTYEDIKRRVMRSDVEARIFDLAHQRLSAREIKDKLGLDMSVSKIKGMLAEWRRDKTVRDIIPPHRGGRG